MFHPCPADLPTTTTATSIQATTAATTAATTTVQAPTPPKALPRRSPAAAAPSWGWHPAQLESDEPLDLGDLGVEMALDMTLGFE